MIYFLNCNLAHLVNQLTKSQNLRKFFFHNNFQLINLTKPYIKVNQIKLQHYQYYYHHHHNHHFNNQHEIDTIDDNHD